MKKDDTVLVESSFEMTDREKDIVERVAQGLSTQEITNDLLLSTGTVLNMPSVILDKLEIRDWTQLAIHYRQRKVE